MNFFIPIEFEKAQTKKGEKIMKIKGIASTADTDSDGEILMPVGFDLSRFLDTGFLNWNHQAKNDASKIVGEPTAAYVTPNGELFVEGVLYNGHPLAESIWSMAETLERNGSKRKIGFSIEGRAIERDIVNPKKITKALLTGLAITPTPVNCSTYMDIVKGEQSEDWVEYETKTIIEKSEDSKYIYEFESNGKKYGICKDFTVEEIKEIEKDMNTSNTAMLSPESLDKKVRVLEPNIKKAVINGLIPLKWMDKIEKGKKAVVGEIRTISDGSKHQKQADGSWKKVSDGDPNFKYPEPKKTWYNFMPHKDLSRLSESVKRMTGEEVKSLLDSKIKKRDNSMTGRSDKIRLREEIWDLEKIMEAHKKAQES